MEEEDYEEEKEVNISPLLPKNLEEEQPEAIAEKEPKPKPPVPKKKPTITQSKTSIKKMPDLRRKF